MTERPLVLLSNDDGHAAAGLLALREALSEFADVVVCAPEHNQSATSHSLSLHRSLRLTKVKDGIFALDGTPADCVYVALNSGDRILPRRPDIAVSGLNHGLNLGIDVFYSGTVAAAREAALRGIPSLATSADQEADRAAAAALSAGLSRALWKSTVGASHFSAGIRDSTGMASARHPGRVLLNVNIPRGDRWIVRSTRLGARLYDDGVIYRHDPRGREYLWLGGVEPRHTPVPGSDTDAYDAGEASVTPLSLDLFDATCAPLAAEVVAAQNSR
jgi:5'-nucleotidase